MGDRVPERKIRPLRGALRRPDPPTRNNLNSSQRPEFGASRAKQPEELRLSRTFRTPSLTSSDEEDIDAQETLIESSLSNLSISSPTTHSSQHLSQLGNSSSLFSDHQEDLPQIRSKFQAAKPDIEDTKLFQFPNESEVRSKFQAAKPDLKDTKLFQFPNESAPKMVVEHDPPKATPQKPQVPLFANVQQPQFGQPSPLQNKLKQPQHPRPPKPASMFIHPKPNQPRPEHHRPIAPVPSVQPTIASNGVPGYMQPTSASTNFQAPTMTNGYSQVGQSHQRPVGTANQSRYQPEPTFRVPFGQNPTHPPAQSSTQAGGAPTIPQNHSTTIPRPLPEPTWSSYPKPQPTFSATGTGKGYTVYTTNEGNTTLDYTGTMSKANPSYDPPGLFDDQFGSADPHMYVDAKEAAQNIKALLEGAFDDEDEKPRTRGRRKKLDEKTDPLADKLEDLNVKGEENKENVDEQEDEEDEEDIDDGTVEGLKVKLLPHQVEGVEWMRDREGASGHQKKNRVLPKGGILADDMGLGKTIQSLSLILTNPRPPLSDKSNSATNKKASSSVVGKNTLVVAPLALIKQWEGEIRDRVEESHKLKVLVHHGPQRTNSSRDLMRYDVVITTYQILVSEHNMCGPGVDGHQAGCFGVHWYRVILDEAHSIKNCNAKSTKACYALRSEYRWCLTGTPMQNNLDELQSLIRFLRIKPYDDISVWREQITRPMSQGRGGVAIRRLQLYLKAFMKRRTKDVLKKEGALNPGGKATSKEGLGSGFKITQRRVESLHAEFSPEERQFYDRLEQRTDKRLDAMMSDNQMSYASALVLLLRLRQACNHPKLLGVSLSKDSDALTTGQTSQTKKVGPATKDIDEMADLLGGLSVQTKQCDVCQVELSEDIISAQMTRCSECEEDLAGQLTQKPKPKSKKGKDNAVSRKLKQEPRSRQKKNVVVDSDDEEEGEWIVREDQRHAKHLGKAGGSDDENAEGGGESLASSDTDTDDEANDSSGSQPTPSNESDDDKEGSDDSLDGQFDKIVYGKKKKTKKILADSSASLLASAKIRHLLKLLKAECLTHKFIVYSQFTSMLDLIEPFLISAELSHVRYDGSMRPDAREAALDTLRHDPTCRILLCSLKCGSLGLNLTAASRVVILEPFWNPFVEEQAIDRVHRLTQTVDVIVYKLTVKDTVEGRILELQDRKRALAAAAIEDGAKGGQNKLSMKDILNLFRRDAETNLGHEAGTAFGGGGFITGSGTVVAGDIRDVGRGGRKVSPAVVTKGRQEDAIYGRRW